MLFKKNYAKIGFFRLIKQIFSHLRSNRTLVWDNNDEGSIIIEREVGSDPLSDIELAISRIQNTKFQERP